MYRKLCKSDRQVKDCGKCGFPLLCSPMTSNRDKNTSYEDAGVSIERGNRLVERIKAAASATHNHGVMGNLGGFGALFDLAPLGYQDPVLVSGTDGVGTKIKLAIEMDIHDTIGIDLVAMCANDLLVQGAQPLFFLDYFATSTLDVDVAARVIEGIAEGCQRAGCALIGGETAEMPGMYQPGDYDLAGFCVGAVEREQIIDGSRALIGDALIAIASSGPHSNGYSLIRKILKDSDTQYDHVVAGKPIGELLLSPTRIYVKPLLKLIESIDVRALVHITGGGLVENIPRVLPANIDAVIDPQTWSLPPIFTWLQEHGNVALSEMYRTFNCGVGMVICVADEQKMDAIKQLTQSGETAWLLGHLAESTGDRSTVRFAPL